jgi:hypothetical protein
MLETIIFTIFTYEFKNSLKIINGSGMHSSSSRTPSKCEVLSSNPSITKKKLSVVKNPQELN